MKLKDYRAIVRAAHEVLSLLRRTGHLVPRPCAVCGALRVEGHHDDYRRPHKVRWLCRKHHRAEHGGKSHLYQFLGRDSQEVACGAIA